MSFCLVSPGVAGIATNIAICCSTGVPSHLAQSPAFKAYALTVALLAVKQLILQVVYQFSRIVTGNHSNEEDVTQWDGFLGLDARIGNSDITSRASKCMQSELKSTPYFMGIGFLYLLDAGKKANPAFMYTYLVARVCHSISYMAGWSLPRTGCLLVGLGSELAMTSFVLKAVFFS
eukprot:jgi/Mesvir1/27622/Mv07354-RA.1